MNIAEITEQQITERARAALQVVAPTAGDSTQHAELSLHKIAFFHSKGNTRIVIELDKESDAYGSVNIRECEAYSRTLKEALDDLEKTSGINLNYSLEVSSAGAERELTSVNDVRRFQALPMNVTYALEGGKVFNEVLKPESFEGETIVFRIADCRFNRKKYPPRKLKAIQPVSVLWSNIKKIRLHLDV
ncbi:MAG: hypothetical protein JNJ69_08325 [Leptospiraceae bacterium]|nr:hypothetical protein [Leptospiraceae bacterium]